MKYVFKGSCVALITPFKNDKVDFDALKNLINYQLDNGTDAILVLGTTGEPSTMTAEEKHAIIDFAKNQSPSSLTNLQKAASAALSSSRMVPTGAV